MTMWFLFFLAAVMAIFGIIGYKQGFWPMVLSLILLFVAALIIARRRHHHQVHRHVSGRCWSSKTAPATCRGDLDSLPRNSAIEAVRDERVVRLSAHHRCTVFFGWLIGSS
jgi:hypothetical protein